MANKAATEEITFEVIKITRGIVFCTRCGGTGNVHEKVYHNQVITNICPGCKGTGKSWKKHETRVPLMEALKELKLIKTDTNG